MSRTKLMKLRPSRSRICCRDRGKVSRKTDVRKVPYEKAAARRTKASPLTIFRKQTLNPPKEAMVPLTREDFEKVNYLHNTEPDYELAKYHAELIHSNVEVTLPMLRTKFFEIHKRLGIPLIEEHRRSTYAIKLLGQFRLLRFAKRHGYDTTRRSLRLVKPLLYEIVSQEEPVDAKFAHKMVNAHCTCTPEAKVLSEKVLREDEKRNTVLRSELSTWSVSMQGSSTEAPDLSNLFTTPALPDLFTVPSTSSASLTIESSDDEESSSTRLSKKFISRVSRTMCAFCRRKVYRKYFGPESSHSAPKHIPYKSAEYVCPFPELLPECPVAMEKPEHEMIIASEPETILDSDNDDVYTALFCISQNRTG